MLQNIYYQQKDLFGIVVFGTKHLGQAAQPNHVTTLQSLALCNADKIRELIDILEGNQITHFYLFLNDSSFNILSILSN